VSGIAWNTQSGHYSANPAVNAARGFWKTDLDSLGKRVIDCATAADRSAASTNQGRSNCVLLGDVLAKMKFGDEGAKGRLVASLLDGKTRAMGKAPKRLHQLRLSVVDVESFRVGDSMTRPAAVVSRQAAAVMLNVGVYAIPALPVRPGYELGVMSRAEAGCLVAALGTCAYGSN
jgi:hypothetical protein